MRTLTSKTITLITCYNHTNAHILEQQQKHKVRHNLRLIEAHSKAWQRDGRSKLVHWANVGQIRAAGDLD